MIQTIWRKNRISELYCSPICCIYSRLSTAIDWNIFNRFGWSQSKSIPIYLTKLVFNGKCKINYLDISFSGFCTLIIISMHNHFVCLWKRRLGLKPPVGNTSMQSRGHNFHSNTKLIRVRLPAERGNEQKNVQQHRRRRQQQQLERSGVQQVTRLYIVRFYFDCFTENLVQMQYSFVHREFAPACVFMFL